jgi:hypothetical protein
MAKLGSASTAGKRLVVLVSVISAVDPSGASQPA